jgi:hypothetical protein
MPPLPCSKIGFLPIFRQSNWFLSDIDYRVTLKKALGINSDQKGRIGQAVLS